MMGFNFGDFGKKKEPPKDEEDDKPKQPKAPRAPPVDVKKLVDDAIADALAKLPKAGDGDLLLAEALPYLRKFASNKANAHKTKQGAECQVVVDKIDAHFNPTRKQSS